MYSGARRWAEMLAVCPIFAHAGPPGGPLSWLAAGGRGSVRLCRAHERRSGTLCESILQSDQSEEQDTQTNVGDAHLRQRQALVQRQADDSVDHLHVDPVDEERRDAELLEP